MGDRFTQARPVLGKIRLTLGMTFKLNLMAKRYSKKDMYCQAVIWLKYKGK